MSDILSLFLQRRLIKLALQTQTALRTKSQNTLQKETNTTLSAANRIEYNYFIWCERTVTILAIKQNQLILFIFNAIIFCIVFNALKRVRFSLDRNLIHSMDHPQLSQLLERGECELAKCNTSSICNEFVNDIMFNYW